MKFSEYRKDNAIWLTKQYLEQSNTYNEPLFIFLLQTYRLYINIRGFDNEELFEQISKKIAYYEYNDINDLDFITKEIDELYDIT
jgi:hypothetical protein